MNSRILALAVGGAIAICFLAQTACTTVALKPFAVRVQPTSLIVEPQPAYFLPNASWNALTLTITNVPLSAAGRTLDCDTLAAKLTTFMAQRVDGWTIGSAGASRLQIVRADDDRRRRFVVLLSCSVNQVEAGNPAMASTTATEMPTAAVATATVKLIINADVVLIDGSPVGGAPAAAAFQEASLTALSRAFVIGAQLRDTIDWSELNPSATTHT